MSDTPRMDEFRAKINTMRTDGTHRVDAFADFARTLERELAAMKSQFTKLDKPKYSGAPMMDSVLATRNPEFDAWVASLPPTYWTRYDLSAARIGWEAARS